MRDYFSNYHVAFYLAGVPPIVGGLVLFSVPLVYQRMAREQKKDPVDPSTDKMLKSCSNGDMLPGFTDRETHI